MQIAVMEYALPDHVASLEDLATEERLASPLEDERFREDLRRFGAGELRRHADRWERAHCICRFSRDARAPTIPAGTPEVMKELVAAHFRL